MIPINLAERDIGICKAYKAGRDLADICKAFRANKPNGSTRGRGRPLSPGRVLDILQENGVPLRERDRGAPVPKGYPKDPEQRDDEIVHLRETVGCSLASIAKAYAVTHQRVSKILQDMARGKRTKRPVLTNHPNAVVVEDRVVTPLKASLERRLALQREIGDDYTKQQIERELCRRDVVRFVNNWGWTYDPRLAPDPAWIPFDLFERQEQLLRFIEARVAGREEGLIEKSREIGFTWLAAAYAANKWLFVSGFSTSIGAALEKQVDALGDMASIFEKIRQFLLRLPNWMMPERFRAPEHFNFLRIINPENGNTITGAAGEEIGRGGRATVVIVDEAAHIERAERVEAATSATTNCRIWASSVNGMGNLFARKRHTGVLRDDQVFQFHYRDDPRKNAEWVTKKKRELSPTPWVWAQEFEIDYSASIEGVCIPGVWVEAAVKLGRLSRAYEPKKPGDYLPDEAQLRFTPHTGVAGLDVGGGKAQSVYICRSGPVVARPEVWGDPDTTSTAYRALDLAKRDAVLELNFDEVGIGRGVLSTLTHADTTGLGVVGINTGRPPSLTMWEDEKSSRQKFSNLKAEIWWIMRERFRLTWEYVNFIENAAENAVEHPLNDLIVLPQDSTELRTQLSLPKVFRNEKGRLVLETKIQLAARGVASPDQADALALTFVPGDDPVPIIGPGIVDSPIPDMWAPQWG